MRAGTRRRMDVGTVKHMTDTASTEPKSDLDRLPTRLSPSRAKDYVNCPKAFYYKTIERRPTKNTVENTRGTLAHDALENLFKLPREERTPERAHEFIEPAWDRLKEKDSYKDVAEPGSAEERRMLAYAREMVSNYFNIENPQSFDAGALEYHAEAQVGDVTLHGYIDRLDKAVIPGLGEEKYLISDYKSGKLPRPRYVDDAFFAMRIYALLLFEETGEMPHMLRLIYLKGKTAQEAVYRVIVTPELLERARRDVENIWKRIRMSAASGEWPTKTGPLCNFCDFKPICPAFGGSE